MLFPQTLPAEDEAAPLPHAAGPLQETGSSVPGAAQREHPSQPDLGPASSQPLRDAGPTDHLRREEEPAAAGPVTFTGDSVSVVMLMNNAYKANRVK